jgi:hypothetical protein
MEVRKDNGDTKSDKDKEDAKEDNKDGRKRDVNLYAVLDATKGVGLRTQSFSTVQDSAPTCTDSSPMHIEPKTEPPDPAVICGAWPGDQKSRYELTVNVCPVKRTMRDQEGNTLWSKIRGEENIEQGCIVYIVYSRAQGGGLVMDREENRKIKQNENTWD